VAKLDFYFSVQYGFEEAVPDKSSQAASGITSVAREDALTGILQFGNKRRH
jgi:hypothetical protein